MEPQDFTRLPPDLPVPEDDGAASHLPGTAMPELTLPATDGSEVSLAGLGPGRAVLYVYPMIGRPGVALPDGWDQIPGARGCTPEACGFRDHHQELLAAGAARVFGLSSQSTEQQAEAAGRLHLPFAILSDQPLALGAALGLPTFVAGEMSLYKRLTMIVSGGSVEHVFYPVFPPDQHAGEVLGWLQANPAAA